MVLALIAAAITAAGLGLVLKFASYAFVPEVSQARFILAALAKVCVSLMLLFTSITVFLYGYLLYALGMLGLGLCAAVWAVLAVRLSLARLNDGA